MTKNRLISIFVVLFIAGVSYFLFRGKTSLPVSQPQNPKDTQTHVIDEVNLKFDGKKVMGLQPGKERVQIRNLRVANRATENWKPALEKALVAQGGTDLKDIKVEKLDSFIWTESGVALYVETVKITLQNEQKQSVSFNAMVDSETGKILKNWNQPVVDNFDKRDKFKVRIDPRYLND